MRNASPRRFHAVAAHAVAAFTAVTLISASAVAAQADTGQFSPPRLGLTGKAQVGKTLGVNIIGGWGPAAPAEIVTKWYRDAKAVKIANAYTLSAKDVGRRIHAVVTAKRDGMQPLAVTTPNSPAIAPGTFSKAKVKISGTAQIGQTLKAKATSFGPVKAKLNWRWFRNGKPIKGATKSTYTVVAKDTKKKLSVKVEARRDGYKSYLIASKKTKKVPKKPAWVDERCMTDGTVLCIDKNSKDQRVRLLVDGKVKVSAQARFGAQFTPTREGVFSVYLKSQNHTSTLYNTWMPYAMFFSGGQAVHYSPDFAARGYSGRSHGCVNIRDWDAIRTMFAKVKVGTKVVVYH